MNLLEMMRMYVRVVERGSISAAARDLDMGQPAVSERVDRLERFLGLRLLHRSTRGLQCTSEGQTFYACAQRVLGAVEQALAEVRQDRGVVRIGAPHWVGEALLPAVFLRARDALPAQRVELCLRDAQADLVAEGLDLALRLGPPDEGAFTACLLGHATRWLAASPQYLARHGGIATPADLAGHAFLHVREDGGDELLLSDAAGRAARVAMPRQLTVSHWRPAYEMMLAGLGVGVVYAPACREALARGALVRVLPGYALAPLALSLLVRSDRLVPVRVNAVAEIVRACVPPQLAQQDPEAPAAALSAPSAPRRNGRQLPGAPPA